MSSSWGKRRPLQVAVDAIVDSVNKDRGSRDKLPSFDCFLDCDKEDVEALAKRIIQTDGRRSVLLVCTPNPKKGKKPYQEWVALLASVIRETGRGSVAHVIDNLISELLDYEAPSRTAVSIPTLIPNDLNVVSHEVPENGEQIIQARARAHAWASIEKLASLHHSPVFSRLVGGMRPSVFVFDDYNNYITRNKDGSYSAVPGDRLEKIRPNYGSDLDNLLRSHCKNLNNLSMFCDVQAHKLWRGENSDSLSKDSLSKQVADALPLEFLERMRDRIGAFLVDLEWEPKVGNPDAGRERKEDSGWSESKVGFRAIRLLSLRFPEIPCFVYSGRWSEETLLEALRNGARWCFYKESHHGYSVSEQYQITSLELEHHLCSAAEAAYGAFAELPFAEQLVLNPARSADKALMQKLDLQLPLDRDVRWREIGRILAKLFPNGEELCPVKVFESGKSKAQAAFVVRPFRDGVGSASRFLKVAPWLEIQREYQAYQQTIRPHVNSNVANIVDPPVLSGGIKGDMPLGMLSYSMAGLPEDYDDLRPLDELLHLECDRVDADQCTKGRLKKTLEQVLWPLYGKGIQKDRLVQERPLWGWLGDVLPPVFTGVLVPLDGNEENKVEQTVGSWQQQGFKDSTAWQLAAMDTLRLEETATDEGALSPWHLQGTRVELSGFRLQEIEWEIEGGVGEITLAHPDLGWRIRLRGKADDIRLRFGAMWVRPALPVRVVAIIEKSNREIERVRRRLRTASDVAGVSNGLSAESEAGDWPNAFDCCDGINGKLPDPFEWLCGGQHIPYSFTISARRSPVHGDLNLQNILFAGEVGPGWLIDFERSVPKGMPAFDLAKLEAEIWHHHLFGLIQQLGDVVSTGHSESEASDSSKFTLLHAALTAVDSGRNSCETFKATLRAQGSDAVASDDLSRPVCKLLETVAMVRAFGQERLKLCSSEQHWALAAYFFAATKFAHGDQPWRALFSMFASAVHLEAVAPMKGEGMPAWDRFFRQIRDGGARAANARALDGLLIHMSEKRGTLEGFTAAMGKPPKEKRFKWPKNTERWDLASTGSINNITPLFGYLWLMVKARVEMQDGEHKVMVPKISSPGSSGGTVDILESGGLHFPSEPGAIVELCRRDGGVLCRQDNSLTPVDKAFMNQRRKTNTMKSAPLVYASILAKKIAMGCTHAIVDVKVGRDSKMMLPEMSEATREALVTGVEPVLLPNSASDFKQILDSIRGKLSDGETSSIIETEGMPRWVEQLSRWEGLGDQPYSMKVRWFFTNSDVPQCRATGRQLILLHLEDLICETYGDQLLSTTKYKDLYLKLIPSLCDVDGDEGVLELVKAEWRRLRSRLPRWGEFVLKPFFEELKSLRKNGVNSTKLEYLAPQKKEMEKGRAIDRAVDLRVITLPIAPYQLSAVNGCMVNRIDAWRLDPLFDWLCGEAVYDPEVGIYLHRMPGEAVVNPESEPFISVFFRPSRTKEEVLRERVRRFLSEGVVVELYG